jgi:hypothetical protein
VKFSSSRAWDNFVAINLEPIFYGRYVVVMIKKTKKERKGKKRRGKIISSQ